MKNSHLTREEAWSILTEYNKEAFHLRHALTVEALMRQFALTEGYAEEVDFWGLVGLLHDLDFELYPEEHCVKVITLLEPYNPGEDLIHAIVCHGYGICSNVKPEHLMEKLLFAADELSGLIWAYALMRPSKSVQDIELKSLKKKFKDKSFAAGCSRETIAEGAQLLGWDLDQLLERTLNAMKLVEADLTIACEGL